MIEDITNSVKAELYGRAVSPLFGAFFLSWAVWNWKFWLVVFSSMEVSEKIDFIDGVLYSGWLQPLVFLVMGPLLTALAYIYIYPIPARFVYKHSGKQQRQLKAIKVEIEDEMPMTQEEHNRLRQKISNLESAYYAELASKDSEIDRLRALIESSRNIKQPPIVETSTDVRAKNLVHNSKQFPLTDTDQPIITEFEVNGEIYTLGQDFSKSRPGEANVVKLRGEFNLHDVIHVRFKTNKPLLEAQYYRVFDGYGQRNITEQEFEIHKTDYEQKNAFFCVMQPNPSREGKEMTISNRVQFAY
ncbi:hypothetical protein ACJO1Z_22865 [Vibrio parahaemolyticus]|uniref:hypothetical protein n=1 Tax=Vibrio TaxID=662 RepID=UPI000BA9943B|nr:MULTISPECIES: hypothetical protein [Vibrio]MBE4008597.1 hypothetical protein [Vibrio parahaemolyticus]MBE4462934.1 hypothetical protein [Vibrio parahaemolyticus]MDN4714315.1 hypothetical protein [Vibrio parahaemolyticus]PAR79877.1 hypothetical protein CGT85_18235 [Vibrio cholerae]